MYFYLMISERLVRIYVSVYYDEVEEGKSSFFVFFYSKKEYISSEGDNSKEFDNYLIFIVNIVEEIKVDI